MDLSWGDLLRSYIMQASRGSLFTGFKGDAMWLGVSLL